LWWLLVRAARRKAEELEAQGKTVLFYIAGRKGRPVLQRLYPKNIIAQFDTSEMKAPSYSDALAISKDIVDRYITDGVDVVHLAYANFRSTLVQEPTVEQIIPVAPRTAQESEPGATSAKTAAPAAVEYEPDEEEILADLLPRNIAVQIYHALLENQAGFYGSQMTAMDNATRNAGDMINRLTIQYNRTRQAAIRGGDDDQMRVVLARPDKELWALRPGIHARGEGCHDLGHPLGIRPRGGRVLLGAAKLRRRHHVQRLGDLLRRLDRADADLEGLQ
jgi:hypothetical protein